MSEQSCLDRDSAEYRAAIEEICSATGWRVNKAALLGDDDIFRVRTDDAVALWQAGRQSAGATGQEVVDWQYLYSEPSGDVWRTGITSWNGQRPKAKRPLIVGTATGDLWEGSNVDG